MTNYTNSRNFSYSGNSKISSNDNLTGNSNPSKPVSLITDFANSSLAEFSGQSASNFSALIADMLTQDDSPIATTEEEWLMAYKMVMAKRKAISDMFYGKKDQDVIKIY